MLTCNLRFSVKNDNDWSVNIAQDVPRKQEFKLHVTNFHVNIPEILYIFAVMKMLYLYVCV